MIFQGFCIGIVELLVESFGIYLDCLIWDLFVPGAIKDYCKIC